MTCCFLEAEHGSLAGARVLLLGVSYRGDVGDTRFSPVELFYECLRDAGADVRAHDPYVGHWPETELAVEQNLARALAEPADVVVISAGHSLYRRPETMDALLAGEGRLVYDTIGVLSAERIVALRQRHQVKVLGRGDL